MATAEGKPGLKEERPEYKLLYNDMPARYIRDARVGDAGYHPGQPKQVIIEVEVTKSATPYEMRVPANDLKPAPEDAPPPETRAWPPLGVPSPESERREFQRKTDADRAAGIVTPQPLPKSPPPLKYDTKAEINQPIPADEDEEEEVEEEEVDHKGEKTGKKTVKKVKKSKK